MYKVTQALRDRLVELGFAKSTWDADHNVLWDGAAVKAVEAGKLKVAEFNELVEETGGTKSVSPTDVFGGAKVKRPSARYDATKSVGRHSKTGLPVSDERGRQVQTPSQLEHAKAGVFLKFLAGRSGQQVSLNEHERELLGEMLEHDKWCGQIDGEWKTGIDGMRIKALLADSTSGGLDAVPEHWDANLVVHALLTSELLPRVQITEVPRSNRVSTAAVSTPTATWGTAEGTAISPFNTADIISAIDSSIHPITCAVEIGRDLLLDSPADLGRVLVAAIGERLLEELDKSIAIGNGTNQPQGIFNASSIADIGNPAGGSGADWQVTDLETLYYAVEKQYRGQALRPTFIMNDTSYGRIRGIPVGASDARRVFGMSHSDYELLGNKVAICNHIGNAVAGFASLAKYRLYRRQGGEVRFTDQGRELALKNQTLLVFRGRYGGRLMDPNAASMGDNFKA